MKVEIEQLPSIRVVLTNEEAVWLMNFLQNTPSEASDPSSSVKHRVELFTMLRGYLT